MTRRQLLVSGMASSVVSLGLATKTVAKSGRIIAAAASLRFAFEEALKDFADDYQAKHGRLPELRIIYGATRTLARQIENGAPFEALFAAETESPQRLSEKQLGFGAPQVFANGRLALVSLKTSALELEDEPGRIKAALTSLHLNRLAIANPDLAPYGRAAVGVLKQVGVWPEIQKRLAIGENVGQAAQFALSGAAEAGLISLSLTRAPQISKKLSVAHIPANWHQPITHSYVKLQKMSDVTEAFCAFWKTAEGAAILQKHGFFMPDV